MFLTNFIASINLLIYIYTFSKVIICKENFLTNRIFSINKNKYLYIKKSKMQKFVVFSGFFPTWRWRERGLLWGLVPHGRAALPHMARRLSSRIPTTQHDQQWCTVYANGMRVCISTYACFSRIRVNLGRSHFWNVQPSRVRFTIGRSSLDNNSDDCARVYRY